MLQMFLLAALITLGIALVFLGGLAAGITCFFIRRLRYVAPFVLLIPTLAALGAITGSWGTAVLAEHATRTSTNLFLANLPLYVWLIGLPAGGVIGALIGLGLSLLWSHRRATHPRR